ncbi:carboxypeptidase-like regulatory domain-containing protein [Schlesneria sp. T3-172]|uniref:carboxypeptidase-like regulatory domain-containing protein n=1 Tax=Schlesneria sphaerica TaxID=3373610 RepID=UPI0037C5DA69
MPILKLVRGISVTLAAMGMVVPMSTIQAAEATSKVSRTVHASVAADVAKLSTGEFAGRIVDHTGAVVKNAEVVVRQGKAEIVRTRTDAEGMFSVNNLKPGAYQVSSGTTEGLFRVWNEESAPPSARKNALIVLGHNGARGQYANCDECPPGGWCGFRSIDPTIALLTAGVIAAVVLSAITLSKVNGLDDCCPTPTSP